ncbi:hypothetical protein LPJ61_000970 [Coemansia biformis]|uniref:beta-glucosidase n=1 Tax=Coemansia biformis TaxID=1286918 RepID=A0A9W7YHV1_9FUNG|nr:hypothetical protein LPJ61_000970 [Coemansia biformis]
MLPVTVLLDSAGNLNITAAEYWIGKWSVGSFFDSPASAGHGRYNWYSAKSLGDFTDAVQHVAAKHGARLPVIWGIDSVRGANYVKGAAMFPAGVGLAATFSPRLAYEAGRVSAKDTRAAGYQWAFAPMQDVSVNKLWSRGYEGFGEDPFLSSEMASASVHGYQGDYKHDRTRVAACMKHFIGYGYPFNGQDRGNRHIAMHELLEYYLPPFTASVRAGAATAMESYGAINGEPVIMSNLYLQRLLREKLGFQGLLVSDAGEISSQAALYKTAANDGQATFATLNRTSIDMSMATTDLSFCMVLHELVTNGYIPESRLDESVARVLQLKKDLGLFENPFVDRALQKTVGSAQDIEDARNAARESITLLKNANGVLPLKPHDRVLFVGPTINSTRFMGGGWNVQWQGPPEARGDAVYQGHGDTVLEGVKRVTSQTPCYYEGVDIDGTMLIGIDKIIAAAKRADKVVIGLGEHTYAEKGGDIGNLALPAAQLELVYAIAELAQKPTVVVLFAGRPRILEHVPKVADAIINAYLPGAYGGLPVAEVLYGKVNPSGRLPYTYPATESQADMTVWQPAYSAYDPQWGFGYGLGYSHISYSNITLSSTTICIGAPITATVAVTNHGTMAQKETVMLFTRLPFRFDLAPENLRLRAFAKIELRPGETRTVSLHLRAEDLAYWDVDLKQRIPPSAVTLLVNPYTQPGLAASAQIVVDPTESLDSF